MKPACMSTLTELPYVKSIIFTLVVTRYYFAHLVSSAISPLIS